ncbi:hypothetical protein Moror_14891 [Moniliophthora roreri MCA 2997]|uniref:Uncharacterized protein n=1 Tax=Moniliophthora roreri (strain MCA 2997) TaxID=1381753 RepID=V2WLU1_MONRO|nr:hypothetical protein Moror_14891 [Moniliophthora roreri MCA 2997]
MSLSVSNVTLATNGRNNGSKTLVVALAAAVVDSEVLPPAQGALLSLTFLAGLLLLVLGIRGDTWKALIACEMSVRGRSSSKKAANGKELSEEELKKDFEFPSSDGSEPDRIQLYTLSKSRLKAVLIDYSSKKDEWHKTRAGARRKHKGTQPGSKKKALKSYERHRLQKESGISTSTPATVEQLRKDTRTKAEKIARLETARQYQRDHPKYQEPSIRQPLHSTQLNPFSALADINNKVDTLAWLIQQQSLHSGLRNGTTVVDTNKPSTHRSGLPNVNVYATNFFATAWSSSDVSSQLIPSSSSQPSMPVPGHIRHTAHAQLITPIQPVAPTSHSVSFQHPTSSQPISLSATPDPIGESVSTLGAAKSGKMKMIKIGDGSEIFFCRKDVRDPQCPSSANNLDLLGHMWDNKNEDFDEDKCVLWVGNPERGIALKYWGDVLKLESPDPDDNHWEVWKKKLYPWGLIGEYYNEVGEKKFWEEFTVDGVRLCQKQIVDILRPRNKAKNALHNNYSPECIYIHLVHE